MPSRAGLLSFPPKPRDRHQDRKPKSTGKVRRTRATQTGAITEEAEQGIVELFERIRCGATLEEALALFPLVGDESSPE